MRDLEFIAGRFVDLEIPKDQRFLLKYFRSEAQVAFLRYYIVFNDWRCFSAHTGHLCSKEYVRRQEAFYHKLMTAYQKAKSSMTAENIELMMLLESGKFK